MTHTRYIEANRESWNEVEPRHRAARFAELSAGFAQPGYSVIGPEERAVLDRVGFAGKRVAHLCCNSGIELLSLINLGAREGVGFDISDAFIAQARELAALRTLPCEFVRTNVYEIPAAHNGRFDLILVTIGAIGWMPDLPAFFAVARRLMASGAGLFVRETHPILDMFDPESPEPTEIRHSYFRTPDDPYCEPGGLDYLGGTVYDARPSYWFHHKLSDVIGGVLAAGLRLTAFEEYPDDISNAFARLDAAPNKPPMSYVLTARAE